MRSSSVQRLALLLMSYWWAVAAYDSVLLESASSTELAASTTDVSDGTTAVSPQVRNAQSVRRSSTIQAFPCSSISAAPLQVLDNNKVSQLNLDTGVYTVIWNLPSIVVYMNSADISPKDGKTYGSCGTTQSGTDSAIARSSGTIDVRYLCRFDSTSVQYLAKVPDSLQSEKFNAATIDENGDYWGLSNSLSVEPGIYYIARPDLMTGYNDVSSVPSSASAPFNSAWLNYPETDHWSADLTHFLYDFLGTGSTETWLVGLTRRLESQGIDSYVRLVCVRTRVMYLLTVSGGSTYSQWTTYGAAMTYKDSNGVDRVFFASNVGTVGVYELVSSTVILSDSLFPDVLGTSTRTGTVSLRHLGVASHDTSKNDGLNCPNKYVPFPTCGDKDGNADGGHELHPVTDAECGTGYYYKSTNAGESCSVNPCEVGSAGAADQSLCCSTTSSAPTSSPTTAAPTGSPCGDTLVSFTSSGGPYAPRWSPDEHYYVQNVPYATTEITVTGTPDPSTAIVSWSIDGEAPYVNTVVSTGEASSGSIALTAGTWHEIIVTVSGPGCITQAVYNLRVLRAVIQDDPPVDFELEPPVQFASDANPITISQGSFYSPNDDHFVLVAWISKGFGVTCSVVGVEIGDYTSTAITDASTHANTSSTSVSVTLLDFLPSDSSVMAAALCFITEETAYCGWVNVRFDDGVVSELIYVTDSQVTIGRAVKEVAIASMVQSTSRRGEDKWYLVVCYSQQEVASVRGECNLLYGDGMTTPTLHPAGPAGNEYLFSPSNTAALSLSAFNSTAAIVSYSVAGNGACRLLIRTATSLSSKTALTYWPDQQLTNVTSTSVSSFGDGTNGDVSSVVCLLTDSNTTKCFPVRYWESDYWGTDLASGVGVTVADYSRHPRVIKFTSEDGLVCYTGQNATVDTTMCTHFHRESNQPDRHLDSTSRRDGHRRSGAELTQGTTSVVADKRSAVLSVSSLTGCQAGVGATCYIYEADNSGYCQQVEDPTSHPCPDDSLDISWWMPLLILLGLLLCCWCCFLSFLALRRRTPRAVDELSVDEPSQNLDQTAASRTDGPCPPLMAALGKISGLIPNLSLMFGTAAVVGGLWWVFALFVICDQVDSNGHNHCADATTEMKWWMVALLLLAALCTFLCCFLPLILAKLNGSEVVDSVDDAVDGVAFEDFPTKQDPEQDTHTEPPNSKAALSCCCPSGLTIPIQILVGVLAVITIAGLIVVILLLLLRSADGSDMGWWRTALLVLAIVCTIVCCCVLAILIKRRIDDDHAKGKYGALRTPIKIGIGVFAAVVIMLLIIIILPLKRWNKGSTTISPFSHNNTNVGLFETDIEVIRTTCCDANGFSYLATYSDTTSDNSGNFKDAGEVAFSLLLASVILLFWAATLVLCLFSPPTLIVGIGLSAVALVLETAAWANWAHKVGDGDIDYGACFIIAVLVSGLLFFFLLLMTAGYLKGDNADASGDGVGDAFVPNKPKIMRNNPLSPTSRPLIDPLSLTADDGLVGKAEWVANPLSPTSNPTAANDCAFEAEWVVNDLEESAVPSSEASAAADISAIKSIREDREAKKNAAKARRTEDIGAIAI